MATILDVQRTLGAAIHRPASLRNRQAISGMPSMRIIGDSPSSNDAQCWTGKAQRVGGKLLVNRLVPLDRVVLADSDWIAGCWKGICRLVADPRLWSRYYRAIGLMGPFVSGDGQPK